MSVGALFHLLQRVQRYDDAQRRYYNNSKQKVVCRTINYLFDQDDHPSCREMLVEVHFNHRRCIAPDVPDLTQASLKTDFHPYPSELQVLGSLTRRPHDLKTMSFDRPHSDPLHSTRGRVSGLAIHKCVASIPTGKCPPHLHHL